MCIDIDEIIPVKALRKLDALFLQNEVLQNEEEMKDEILLWARELVNEVRKEWDDLHSSTIENIITQERKAEAFKSGKNRDSKYAPFREYFKKIQERKFREHLQHGKMMSANSFVLWFLENKAKGIKIPYCQTNQKNKLVQLAQINNREFKKAFAC